MAKYLKPKIQSLFNPQNFSNQTVEYKDVISNSISSTSNTSGSLILTSTGTESLTLQDSLLQQHHNDLSITTDDGYNIHINNNKPTSGDIIINENTNNSNVNIMNGNLTIYNGILNLKNGSILLDNASINAQLEGNKYELSVQADTIANHNTQIQTHSVVIQELSLIHI